MHGRIFLVGATIALESIYASLAEMPNVALYRTASTTDRLPSDFMPDAVIFDMTSGIPDCVCACLAAHQDLLLLGLDFWRHEVLLLSSASAPLSTVADLADVLKAAVPRDERPTAVEEWLFGG